MSFDIGTKWKITHSMSVFGANSPLDLIQKVKEYSILNEMYHSYYQGENKERILDQFMKIKDDMKLEEFQAYACCGLID